MTNMVVKLEDIDVCLILFNEEIFIESCLKALKPYFERVVVLDMGSADRTTDIVQDIYGDQAILVSQPRADLFRYGFAHARNKVTAAARKPWVLHVDADEILAPLEGEALSFPDSSAQGGCAARVHRRNLVGATMPDLRPDLLATYDARSVEQHVRLYRKAPQVRWQSFLHE